jgi:hypothetical protein
VKRIFIALVAGLGVAAGVALAQTPQYPGPPTTPTSTVGTPPPPPPPPPPDLANCNKQPAKLSLQRARYNRIQRTTSIFAPITRLASGAAQIQLFGAGRITEFTAPVNSAAGYIRATRGVDVLQARAESVILTIHYLGDADTRPQTLRLRAGLRAAKLSSRRPTISPTGQLDAAGAITKAAKGVVRVQLEWVNATDGSIVLLERQALIHAGRWGVRYQLPPGIVDQIAHRCSTVQSYVLFTGFQPRLMNGEMRSFQVMPAPVTG